MSKAFSADRLKRKAEERETRTVASSRARRGAARNISRIGRGVYNRTSWPRAARQPTCASPANLDLQRRGCAAL
jgi:hypothetical protein